MDQKDPAQFIGGFVRDRGEGRGIRVAKAKVDELPFPDPTTVQDTLSALQGTRTYPNIKSPLKARVTKLACLGIPSHILDQGSPEYARCIRLANSYKKARTKELYSAHGYVSSGVSALLAAASLALSASRFLYEAGCSTPFQPAERGHLGQAQLLKLASSLGDSARQNELSAWELCAREGVVVKRNRAGNEAMPWLVAGVSAPEEKRKPGRPRKVEYVNAGA